MAVAAPRPGGILRVLFKAPTLLFRLRLGRLLGRRFLLLAHRGRASRRLYRTPLEVVRYDPAKPEAVVVAAWGERADWYRNITVSPPVEVRVAGCRWPRPQHRRLTPDETLALLEDYRREHPLAARAIARFLGWPLQATGAAWQAFARSVVAVAFSPRPEDRP